MAGWNILMLVFWLLFIVGNVLLIIWLVPRVRRARRERDSGREEALAILRERYARGEVTREQYEQMQRDLE